MTNRPQKLAYFSGLDLGRTPRVHRGGHTRTVPARGCIPTGLVAVRRPAPGAIPAGHALPAVFRRLAGLFAAPPLIGSTLVADQTAVGRPVLDPLKRSGVHATVRAVSVTAGLAAHLDERGGWLVPRIELVGTLQMLLQSGRLKVADALPEAATLVGSGGDPGAR